MGRLVLLMALLPIVVQGASLEDRAVEAMKLVDISDRAIDDWWKTFTTMWNTYDTKISAQPTLACTDWENLLKELGEIKTQIGLVEDGLKALKAQLVAIREILEHATWGTTSGLHCQKTPEESICKALKELDDLADEKQKKLDGEKKIVDDEITRIKTYDCNCTWKPWAGAWEKCSKTCEEGIQTEKRTILWNVRNNGVPCNLADATRTRKCDDGCCPVDCKWNDWEKWGECPNVCSADTQYRRRVRSKAQTMMCESRGGQKCIGGPNDKEECKILEVWDKRIDGLKEKHAGLQKQIDLYKEKLCDPNPCANGGSCNEGACTCKGDWTGYHCKVNSAPKPDPISSVKPGSGCKTKMSEEQTEQMFDVFDIDPKDKILSEGELYVLLMVNAHKFKSLPTAGNTHKMFIKADGDGDNHLSYDEFKCNVVNLFTGKDASKAEPNPPPSTGGLMGGGLGGLGGLLSG